MTLILQTLLMIVILVAMGVVLFSINSLSKFRGQRDNRQAHCLEALPVARAVEKRKR